MKDKINLELKNFTTDYISEAMTSAANGWVFALNYDKLFLEEVSENVELNFTSKQHRKHRKHSSDPKLEYNNDDFFSKLLSISDIKERWSYLEDLTNSHYSYLLEDSFASLNKAEAEREAAKFLSEEKFSIVIIGAGCIGLFFANILKKKLGDDINILICENRAYKSRVKKPYSREWVTNIPLILLENYIDSRVFEIVQFFGQDFYMGAKINMLETLLLLSCKNMGVSFYFEPDMDLKFIKESGVDLVIDATAGKIDHLYDKQQFAAEVEMTFRETIFYNDYDFAGINIIGDKKPDITKFLLCEKLGRYYPVYNGRRIKYPLFKIKSISTKYYDEIMAFVKKHNHDNIFYVWAGRLKEEINEVLIIINTNSKVFKKLSNLISEPIGLNEFSKYIKSSDNFIDKRIILLVNKLINYGEKWAVVEKPFIYEPFIKLLPNGFTSLYGKTLVPIGDSLFPGHVKCGNGLGYHIIYAKQLEKRIINCIYSLDQLLKKAVNAHQAGNLLEAENLYRFILNTDEHHSDANHNLGVLALNCGHPDSAIMYFEKAINSNYTIAQYWISLVDVLLKLGRVEDAKKLVLQAKDYGVSGVELNS